MRGPVGWGVGGPLIRRTLIILFQFKTREFYIQYYIVLIFKILNYITFSNIKSFL